MDRTLTIAMPGERGWPLVVCEVVRPERLVHTESWEDWDPGELLVTVVLREQGSTTRRALEGAFAALDRQGSAARAVEPQAARGAGSPGQATAHDAATA